MAALVLGASLVASSCTTVANDAARVGERSLSADELDELVVSYEKSTGDSQTPIAGPRDAAVAREILATWLTTSVTLGLIADAGGELSEEALAAAEESLNNQAGFADADQKVRELFIRDTAATATLSRLLAPAAAELAAEYEQGPAVSGVVCVRAILTEDQASIDLAASRIASGESFADVAAELSVDPSAADGGVLAGQQGNQCIDFASVVESVPAEFVTALENTAVGSVSVPFEIPTVGWALLLPRAFDEVGEDVVALTGSRLAASAITDALRSVDAWVNAEYGRWDSATGTVVAVG